MKRRLNFNSLVCKYLFNLGRLGEDSTEVGQLTACLQATNFCIFPVKAGSTKILQCKIVSLSIIHMHHTYTTHNIHFLCKLRGGDCILYAHKLSPCATPYI